jgi:SAM-dependent methyltransferase
MDDPTLNKIKDLYSENLAAFGAQSKSVGWKTPESQELRFEKLTSIIEDRSSSLSINDYGCGYGAQVEFLKNSGVQIEEYNGYDLSEEMLEQARQQLKWFKGRLNLYKSDTISTKADYTFVSGTFNVRFNSDDILWEKFIESKLNEINLHSKKGFAFNLLSTYVDWKEPELYYGDPTYWFNFCKNNYSKYVSLLHDYPLYEWTILVKN